MSTATREAPPHGTEGRYKGTKTRPACRCRRCVAAQSKAGQARQLAHLEGRPPKVPSAPITAHIRMLADKGLSLCTIARAANTSRDTINEHAAGRLPTIRRATAERILAVRASDFDAYSRIPVAGTRRRVQALYRIGHGPGDIAGAAGVSLRFIEKLINEEQATVTVATRDKVAAAYRRLSVTPGGNDRARRRAASEGWVGPLAWDDIDDVDATPEAAQSVGLTTQAKRCAARNDDIRHLASFGESEEQIAIRLGLDVKDVRGRLAKWRREDALTQHDTETAA